MHTRSFWRDGFSVTTEDIDFLKAALLERETPLSTDELSLVVMQHRASTTASKKTTTPKKVGKRYSPYREYEVGESLLFSAHGERFGELLSTRSGRNPDQGDFEVGLFRFDDASEAEFLVAAPDEFIEFAVDDDEDEGLQPTVDLTPEEMFIEFGGIVSEKLEDALAGESDLVELAGYWFPEALLVEVNEGHLNLAEAILDMMEGGPMSTSEIMEQVGILQNDQQALAEFSLNHALQQDTRFDEVGPAGQVMWHLVRMEPDEAFDVPQRLQYKPITYDVNVITEEFRELEVEIGDPLSRLPRLYPNDEVVTVTLLYPYLRTGTLPLSHRVRGFFPTAYEAPRIRFTLIDRDSGVKIPGWVVREHGYVYGLSEWYLQNDVPVGAYVEVRRVDLGAVEVGLRAYNPRVEWVPTMTISDGRLQFEDQKHRIGSEYDDLFIVKVADEAALDSYKERIDKNKLPIEKLVDQMARALIGLNQQSNVHLKTLYSAVNTVRRCPPGPIIHALEELPQFEHFDGAYWQLKE